MHWLRKASQAIALCYALFACCFLRYIDNVFPISLWEKRLVNLIVIGCCYIVLLTPHEVRQNNGKDKEVALKVGMLIISF